MGEVLYGLRPDQRLQLHATHAHPLRQAGASDGVAGTPKARLLAVQGQMVRILGHQHLCQQTRGRQALVDDLGGHRRLRQDLALGASPLATDMALHREHARCVVQLPADIFADALELAATTAGGAVGFLVQINAGQFWRQRCALSGP